MMVTSQNMRESSRDSWSGSPGYRNFNAVDTRNEMYNSFKRNLQQKRQNKARKLGDEEQIMTQGWGVSGTGTVKHSRQISGYNQPHQKRSQRQSMDFEEWQRGYQ